MAAETKSSDSKVSRLQDFTHTEIYQQPELWPTTIDIVRRSEGAVLMASSRPIIVTGAGTSAYAAMAVAASWHDAQGISTTDLLTESPADIGARIHGFADQGLLVSLARSGDSPESVAVVKRIQRLCPSVQHLVITCNQMGQLARTPGVRSIVLDPRTNDRSLAMTSSFSNLVLAGLYLHHGDVIDKALAPACRQVERSLPDMEARAERLCQQPIDRIVILASGVLRSLASEAALKVLEMTAGQTVTLAESFLGLRHGPMSFLTPETVVLCYLSSSEIRRYEIDLITELRNKGLGRIVGIGPELSASERNLFHEWVPANAGSLPDGLRVPFEIPFAQLFAYHLSLRKGLNPDNPSPKQAITRVVQKFAIYDDQHSV